MQDELNMVGIGFRQAQPEGIARTDLPCVAGATDTSHPHATTTVRPELFEGTNSTRLSEDEEHE